MRRTRFMTLFFLVLSAAFFLLPEFRNALQAPALSRALTSGSGAQIRHLGRIPQNRLEALAREGESEKNARKLAFAALHLENKKESVRRAGQAVTLDPDFTWIYFSLVSGQREAPQALEWIQKLQAWDPDNAVPWLLEAERIHATRNLGAHAALTAQAAAALSGETEWRQLMARAFAAPRFDSYANRRFNLEPKMFLELGLATPARMVISLSGYPINNLLNIRQYGNLVVLTLGAEAEARGGRALEDAARHYWSAAHFGERMQLGSVTQIEQLVAASLQLQAYERLHTLLLRMGRPAEAPTLQFLSTQLRRRMAVGKGEDPLTKSTKLTWPALNVGVFVVLVYIFGAATAVTVFYVNAKRWLRAEKRGRLYQFLTIAENYVPILLFFACLGLFLSYYPYAQDFHYYMTAEGETYNLEPFFSGVIPAVQVVLTENYLPVENPFRTYVWYVLAGLILVIAAEFLGARRSKTAGRDAPPSPR